MSRVAILMPVHNAARFLPEAIESVLHQTFRDFRLLLVDDNSSDDSLQICEKYERQDRRIHFFRSSRQQGHAATLNDMLASVDSDAEFIAIAGSRDISEPERLQCQIDFLEMNQEFSGIGSNIRFIDPQGLIIGECRYPQEQEDIKKNACYFCPVAPPTFCYRVSLISEIGGYDPYFLHCDDYEFILRVLEKHHLGNLSAELVNVRHVANLEEVPRPRVVLLNVLRLQRYYLSRGKFFSLGALAHHLASYFRLFQSQPLSLYPQFTLLDNKSVQ